MTIGVNVSANGCLSLRVRPLHGAPHPLDQPVPRRLHTEVEIKDVYEEQGVNNK